MVDVSEIEKRVDRAVTASIPVNVNLGGLDPKDYGQVMEFSKAMSTCRAGIPQWLRGSVGDCLMICTRALRWRMDPYFVAEKTYLMEGRSGTKVGYESQLIHAVIESLAPIKGRLRHEYRGDGDDTVCVVSATFNGEDKPHEYISETLGKRVKDIGFNDKGNFRGSPLWLQKPRLQLFYDASRDWARINCPDVLAGVYTRDELPDMEPIDVTPKEVSSLAQRLKDAKRTDDARGFDHAHVNSTIEGGVNPDAKQEAENVRAEGSQAEPASAGRQDGADRGADGNHDADGSPRDGQADQPVGSTSAAVSEEAAQADIFPPDRKPQGKAKDDKAKGKRK